MVLCFDIGNTDIDVGVFDGESLCGTFHIDYTKGLQKWDYIKPIETALANNGIDKSKVDGCVLCSVVHNTTQGVYLALESVFGFYPMLFSNDEYAAVEVKAKNPQEVGVDIVARCLAVKEKYSLPAVVIDMGTATTITAMDESGAILGVSILTGVITSLKALRDRTGLPIDENLIPPKHVIGKDTPDAIASGAVYASAYAMDGMIRAFEKEMGAAANVYCTGGISKVIMPLCEHKNVINDSLLLEGLKIYYDKKIKEI